MENKTELTAADLALYLGCEVLVPYAPQTERIGQLREVGQKSSWVRFELHTSAYKSHEIKPILRPLSDMTEEEARDLCQIVDGDESEQVAENSALKYFRQREEWYGARIYLLLGKPNAWRYLLSKYFDLFGWIPAGLAIDKTKI